jgi:hypothetical protein
MSLVPLFRGASCVLLYEAVMVGCASLPIEPDVLPAPQVEETPPVGDCGIWSDYETCRT